MASGSTSTPHILMVAGGTGGHVFPAIAIANACRSAGAQVSWLGTGTMEVKLVQPLNIPLFIVPYQTPRSLCGWLALLLAVFRSLRVIKQVRPTVVMGMGGYPSVAGGIAARLCGIPLLIHEQNAKMGRANQLLHRYCATQTLTAFPNVVSIATQKIKMVGNPVRAEFANTAPPAVPVQPKQWRLLVLGGSQGAAGLNKMIPAGAAALVAQGYAVNITHQCGATHAEQVRQAYASVNVEAAVVEFINDVAAAMNGVDLVICRAGASTLAELAAVGAAALLVPYPHAAANHQLFNAKHFVNAGAAQLCEEKELTAESLSQTLLSLNNDDIQRMRARCHQLSQPAAAANIARLLIQNPHEQHEQQEEGARAA